MSDDRNRRIIERYWPRRAVTETKMSGAGSWMGGRDADGQHDAVGGGMILIGLVWLIILVAALVVLAWLIIRGRGPRTDRGTREVLDVRYARGELDRETYPRMGADPTDHGPAAG